MPQKRLRFWHFPSSRALKAAPVQSLSGPSDGKPFYGRLLSRAVVSYEQNRPPRALLAGGAHCVLYGRGPGGGLSWIL